MKYDFPTKTIYRQRKRIAIGSLCKKPVALRKVAFLDTSEALDTIFYLKSGYRAENLYAINRSAAQLAHLTRTLDKQGYPRINTVSGEFYDALLEQVPFVDIVDFDGTGNLHTNFTRKLALMIEVLPTSIFIVNMLVGREQDTDEGFGGFIKLWKRAGYGDLTGIKHSSFGTSIEALHLNRLQLLFLHGFSGCDYLYRKGCDFHVEKFMWDVYRSESNQSMLWVAAKIGPHVDNWSGKTYVMTTPRCFLEKMFLSSKDEFLDLTEEPIMEDK